MRQEMSFQPDKPSICMTQTASTEEEERQFSALEFIQQSSKNPRRGQTIPWWPWVLP